MNKHLTLIPLCLLTIVSSQVSGVIPAVGSSWFQTIDVKTTSSQSSGTLTLADRQQLPDKILVERGESYVRLKQYSQAIASFNQAIEINPQNEMAYLNRGYAYLSQKKYDLAIADFNRGLQLNSPSDPRPLLGRGQAYLEIRQYQRANADLEQAARLLSDRQDSAEYRLLTKLLQQIPR
jgi:tetratricopeptide (TPR) repeat protein